MAVEWAVKNSRGNNYFFPPEGLIANPDLNGRVDLPPIEDLVADFINPEIGQTQPVSIYMGAGKKPIISDGHTRWRAALHVNKHKLTPVPFQLECVYVRTNEMGGFIRGIVSNHHRTNCSPIDDATNMNILLKAGRTEQDIAKIYGKPLKWVNDHLALLTLEPEVKQAVVERRVKPTAAKHIAKLGAQAQRDLVKNNAKVTVADVAPARKSRTIKETVETLDKINGPGVSKKGRAIVQMLIGYLQGEVSEKNFVDNFTEAVS